MKRVLLVLGFILVAPLLTATAVQAGPDKGDKGDRGKKSAPEIDPLVAGGVLTFLAAGTFLIDGRLRNKARDRK